MPKKTYHVCLSPEEEKLLRDITHKGNSHSAKKILHANILLLTNECYPDKRRSNQEVADIFGVSKTTVNQVRKTYAEDGHCVSWQNIVWRTSIWYPFPILLLGICSIQMN